MTDTSGITLESGDYGLSFDPARFSVANVRLGSLIASGYSISANVNNTAGTITVSTFATSTPLNLAFGTSGAVVLMDFTVRAGAASGVTPIDLEANVGTTFEGSEAIVVDISSVTGGTESSPQHDRRHPGTGGQSHAQLVCLWPRGN